MNLVQNSGLEWIIIYDKVINFALEINNSSPLYYYSYRIKLVYLQYLSFTDDTNVLNEDHILDQIGLSCSKL